MSKRAIRRHHRARLKNKRSHHWQRDLRSEPKILGKVVNTPTPCSCTMCCNTRRNPWLKEHERLTRNERRNKIAMKEQTLAYYDNNGLIL